MKVILITIAERMISMITKREKEKRMSQENDGREGNTTTASLDNLRCDEYEVQSVQVSHNAHPLSSRVPET